MTPVALQRLDFKSRSPRPRRTRYPDMPYVAPGRPVSPAGVVGFGGVSGAHFNPAVTLAALARGDVSRREVSGYIIAQVGGAVVGVVVLANLMFELPRPL